MATLALDEPRTSTLELGPNWFASVMGTGILAVVLHPAHPALAAAAWWLAAALLVTLSVATAVHRTSYVDHPVQVHFYGAPAMALMTVGAGALLTHDAVRLDAVLWTLGTVLGVLTALGVPRLTRAADLDTVGPWFLMAVVPPTVSATTGALLAPHVPAGPPRSAYVVLCYALLALSLVGTARTLRLLVRRWRTHGPGTGPALLGWLIVLGPLGQSVTAVHHLARLAPAPVARLTPLYGLPVLLAALVWGGYVAVLLVRARPGFALTWWALTFPVATCVTGATALGLAGLATALTVVLLAAWVVVAARTVHGTLTGGLLRG